MTPLYTVQRSRKNRWDLYGPTHGSEGGDVTLCGQTITESWWILTNDHDGEVTCRKCLKIMEES